MFTVELPQFVQVLTGLPPHLRAALNVSTTAPILAVDAQDWAPLRRLGIPLEIQHASVVVAPNGGTIGTIVFPRGFSAAFDADLFGTAVHFLGEFDEQTRGIVLQGFVEDFALAGVEITGAGPDGIAFSSMVHR